MEENELGRHLTGWKCTVDLDQIPTEAIYLIDQLIELNLDKIIFQKIFQKFCAIERRSVGVQCGSADDGENTNEHYDGEIDQQCISG